MILFFSFDNENIKQLKFVTIILHFSCLQFPLYIHCTKSELPQKWDRRSGFVAGNFTTLTQTSKSAKMEESKLCYAGCARKSVTSHDMAEKDHFYFTSSTIFFSQFTVFNEKREKVKYSIMYDF